MRSITTHPASLALSRHNITGSRHQTGRLCRERKTFVVTGVLKESVATESYLSRQDSPVCTLCHDTKTVSRHNTTSTTQPPCRHTKTISRYQKLSLPQLPVATPKSLSRHGVDHLCRDKESSVATEHPRKPIATDLPRHARARARPRSCAQAIPVMCTGMPVAHATPFLSRHHLQCRDPKLEMGSSPPHLVPCIFSFCSTYCKTNRKLPYYYKGYWNLENST